MQQDSQDQQCALEEEILNASRDRAVNHSWHRVLYLPRYHPELNHIEFFWCQAKRYSRENCNYTFEGLRHTVPAALDSVMNSTILGNYHSCLQRQFDLFWWCCLHSRKWCFSGPRAPHPHPNTKSQSPMAVAQRLQRGIEHRKCILRNQKSW
jgi:transposase